MRQLKSTTAGGLDTAALPFRLFQKAKQHGIWDPAGIDFTRDRGDWSRLSDEERDLLLRLTAMFQAGEESVTLDLLPLIRVIASEGRLEEEMYLTSFLWEEAKHVELFHRFLSEVAADHGDLARFCSPSYRAIVYEALPAALARLERDPSPAAQAEASVTYNMIVEGVLAETGYHGYLTILESRGLMPGICSGIRRLKRDESRHIAYGVYLLTRLVAEGGDAIWRTIQQRMELLLPPALGVVQETFAPYDPIPFAIDPESFLGFAMTQFQQRYARIERGLAGMPGDADGEPDALDS